MDPTDRSLPEDETRDPELVPPAPDLKLVDAAGGVLELELPESGRLNLSRP